MNSATTPAATPGRACSATGTRCPAGSPGPSCGASPGSRWVASVFSLAATGMVYLFIGIFVIGGFVAAWYITVPLVAAPYLLAYVGRQGELRAAGRRRTSASRPTWRRSSTTSRPRRTP